MTQHRLLAAAILTGALTASASAQVTWIQSPINGHWYTTEIGNHIWCVQESIAISYGGHLATIRDQSEQTWIWSTFGGPNNYLAIGASSLTPGTWFWVSGEPFTFVPTNPQGWNPWGANEPNNSLGLEDKGILMGPWGGQWNDFCGCCGPDVQLGLIEVISDDCNQNAIPDKYEIATGAAFDCNSNAILDVCDIAASTSLDCNGNGVPDECESVIGTYCVPKINSIGCAPSISWSGTPTLSGPDNFFVTASNVLNRKPALMIWSTHVGSSPLGGGTLCMAGPVIRTPGQNSGGSPLPVTDCSGQYSFHFSQAYMQNYFLGTGVTIYAQYWSRDPGFAAPNNIGLTNGLAFAICP